MGDSIRAVKKKFEGLSTDSIGRLFGYAMAMILAFSVLLYWQGYIRAGGLILVCVVVLIAGISFTFGTRVCQKDGFLDGYACARNGLKKKKE